MTRVLRAARVALDIVPALVLLALGSSPALAHEGALGNEVMWKVCENRKRNDVCAFRNADHDTSRGSCQSVAEHLVCVRNQPIERAAADSHTHAHDETVPSSTDESGYGWVLGVFSLVVGGVAVSNWPGRSRITNLP
ncbi:MAG: hypothetical protein IPF98_16790 [Gemmatimonadetes bacterium]|nr:hypothetical protein [Gemmatimonadota bacterium]